jgi:hypothetical protein
MAVTAHWLEGIEVKTVAGIQKKLELRADLIGFKWLPGKHDGRHLAQGFINVLDRLNITEKV